MTTAVRPVHTDEENRLLSLYRNAGDLELALQGASQRDVPMALTPSQIGIFNYLLRTAREMVPNSVALKEDIDEIDASSSAAEAYHMLHVTLVPVLHNTLPEDYAV